jgi:hypothetical protein
MLDTERLEVYGLVANHPLETIFGSDREGKRVIRILQGGGIFTLGMLLVRTTDELLTLKGMGGKSLQQVKDALFDRELYLREMWRSKLTAVRYTYRHAVQAPASIILPLRFNTSAILHANGLRTLGDYRQFSQDDILGWRNPNGGPVFLGQDFVGAFNVLTGLRIIKE